MVLSRMDPRQQAPGPDGNEDEDGEQDEPSRKDSHLNQVAEGHLQQHLGRAKVVAAAGRTPKGPGKGAQHLTSVVLFSPPQLHLSLGLSRDYARWH